MDYFAQRGPHVRDRLPRAVSLLTRVLAIAALLAALVPARDAAAQDAAARFSGQTIRSVRIEVEGQPERSAALLAQLDTVPNRPLRTEDVRASIVKLYRIGQYDDITVLASPTAGGVDLLYALTPRHPVDKVDFTGNTGVAPDTLKRLVRQQFGGAPAATRTSAAEGVVTQALEDEGYLRPTVRARLVLTHVPDRATMVFDVEAGVRARLGVVTVTLTGTGPITPAAVVSRTGAVTGEPYSPRAITAALDAIVDDLRQKNYYAASHQSLRPVVSPDGAVVDVELAVSSGPLYRIKFANPTELPNVPQEDLVPVKRLRSVDDDLLEDSERHIADLLRRDGYWHADVTHTREQQGDLTTVTFTVRRGLRYKTAEPDVAGNDHVPTAELIRLLPPAASPYFDQARLDRWRAAILLEYRQRGFAFAEVAFDLRDTTSTEPNDGLGHVVARLNITEGPETRVSAITFHGTSAIPEAELRALMTLEQGDVYRRARMDADEQALQSVYQNRGFREAVVRVTPAFSADHAVVSVAVDVSEGQQTIVDSIVVVDNGSIKEQLVLDQMTVRIGAPYSVADELESKRRLAELQLFRTFDFGTAPVPGADHHVELIVRVEPAAGTTFAFGGGLSIDERSQSNETGAPTQRIEFAPKASFDYSRRNLFGRNRQLSLSTSVTFRPSVSDNAATDGTGFSLGEYHIGGTYRAPHALGPDTDLAVGTSFEKAPRTTFTFVRNTLHADLQRRTNRRINFIGRYTLEYSKVLVFDTGILPSDLLLIDRLFPQVRLSTVSGGMVRDRRDDPVDPSTGTFMSAEADLAARAIGSQVGFIKTLVEVTGFHQVTKAAPDRLHTAPLPRVVLAGRIELGLAHGFGRDVTVIDANGNPQTSHVADLPASERFFAGGSTTVRGFDIDQLGVPAVLDANGLSNGGNGLLVVNGEVRTTIMRDFLRRGGDLGIVAFGDAGNVFAKAADVSLSSLLGTTGAGLRWKSPIGPVRLDIGFKLNPRTINGARESRTGWSFSIGEAF